MRPPLKQHFFKRLVCIVLAVVLFGGFIPLKSEAAEWKYKYKITNLKQNVNVTAKERTWNGNTQTFYLYRINVPANGYISIQTNRSSNGFYFYKSYKKNKSIYDVDSVGYSEGKKTQYIVLSKGVYYIRADEGTKFKWKFTKSKNPTNFCIAKAKTLAPKKKIKTVLNNKYEFDRWYKIKLKKRKTITLTFKELNGHMDFTVFDSEGESINCPKLTDTSYRTETLPKGTYYLRVMMDDFWGYSEYSGSMCQIMWK